MGYKRYTKEDYDGGSDAEGPLNLLLSERVLIIKAHTQFEGNREAMADALGITTRTLTEKIRAHSMKVILV